MEKNKLTLHDSEIRFHNSIMKSEAPSEPIANASSYAEWIYNVSIPNRRKDKIFSTCTISTRRF